MSRSSPVSVPGSGPGSGSSSSPATAPVLSIGELSESSGASPRMLRYYERQGLLHPTRASNGYREYGPDTVTIVAQIRGLLAAGLPTATIRQVLPCAHGSTPTIDPCPEILSALSDELGRLDDRIRHLEASRTALRRYLAVE